MAHVSAVALDTTYAPMHVGAHDTPDAMLVPSPHVAEFETVGSVHGSGSHVNVAGVNTAAVHANPVADETVYPDAHVGAHDAPDASVPPAPHIAELFTVGSTHASGTHSPSTTAACRSTCPQPRTCTQPRCPPP